MFPACAFNADEIVLAPRFFLLKREREENGIELIKFIQALLTSTKI
jgi:hypothetical protein